MAFYEFERTQIINASVDEVWDFIASPGNLSRITPDHMGFEITSRVLPGKMYKGMIISYRVNPLPLYSATWVTEITQVEEKRYFIDEQRKGPYKLWHHEHWLEETEEGIVMKDKICYIPPFGFIGRIANRMIIKNKLKQIFDYRERAIEEIFI